MPIQDLCHILSAATKHNLRKRGYSLPLRLLLVAIIILTSPVATTISSARNDAAIPSFSLIGSDSFKITGIGRDSNAKSNAVSTEFVIIYDNAMLTHLPSTVTLKIALIGWHAKTVPMYI